MIHRDGHQQFECMFQVIEYFFRDYIRYWYDEVSQHEEFLYDLRQTLQKVLIALFSRFV